MNFDDIEILEFSHVGMPTKRWVPVEDYVELGEENKTLRTRLAAAETLLREFADFENPNQPKYVCWPTSEYMKKARTYFEKHGDKPFEP